MSAGARSATASWFGTDQPLHVAWLHFRRIFPGLTPQDICGAARDPELDVTALGQKRAEQQLQEGNNPLHLVSAVTCAALAGTSLQTWHDRWRSNPDKFPVAVAVLSKADVWLEGDVRACIAGRRSPRRQRHELNARVLDRPRLAAMLGGSPRQIERALKSKSWRTVPPPDGRVGTRSYWLREHVERWQKDPSASRAGA